MWCAQAYTHTLIFVHHAVRIVSVHTSITKIHFFFEIIIAANATISRHIVYIHVRTFLCLRVCACTVMSYEVSYVCVVMSYEDQLVKHWTSIPKIVGPTMVRDNFHHGQGQFFILSGVDHRYRRTRLLTVMYSITHATRQHEHSKWRLNRSKIIERVREKPCFSHFTPAYCFRSR